jgi:hypothetical protein
MRIKSFETFVRSENRARLFFAKLCLLEKIQLLKIIPAD